MNDASKLIIVTKDKDSKPITFYLDRDKTVIGHKTDCDIVFDLKDAGIDDNIRIEISKDKDLKNYSLKNKGCDIKVGGKIIKTGTDYELKNGDMIVLPKDSVVIIFIET